MRIERTRRSGAIGSHAPRRPAATRGASIVTRDGGEASANLVLRDELLEVIGTNKDLAPQRRFVALMRLVDSSARRVQCDGVWHRAGSLIGATVRR